MLSYGWNDRAAKVCAWNPITTTGDKVSGLLEKKDLNSASLKTVKPGVATEEDWMIHCKKNLSNQF